MSDNTPLRQAKTPKGMRDWPPERMAILDHVFPTVAAIFKRHGAVPLDTPVMELKSTLLGKYGEDSKLIYDLADQGGEQLSLRYDLTVPFARYLASNKISTIRRYHIGKVYRRDNPAMTRGRFREFFQCDFDIAGTYAPMMPDAECVRIVCEIMDALPELGSYTVKLNHRGLLDGIFEMCGVPEEKFRPICSAVDKLDKLPWKDVRSEMMDKGLEASVADAIGEYVQMKGTLSEMVAQLRAKPLATANTRASTAVEEMSILATYLEAARGQTRGKLSFDLSLARGLDYYTGMILEVVMDDANVGSICGGGRYDNLVGMFSKNQVPSVGFSVGIERILAAIEERVQGMRPKATQVMVCSIGNVPVVERFRVASMLWDAGIATELEHKSMPKIKQQLAYASSIGCPFAVIMGESELASNSVQLKDLRTQTPENVARDQLVDILKQRLSGTQ